MAQPLTCDICLAEEAAQMLTNVQTGDVLMIGMGCAMVFYGQSLLQIIGSDGHAGPPTKCQACRRIHERMTTPVAPMGDVSRETADEIPGQMTVEEAAESS